MADVTSEYAAANGWREIDISGEEWRAYVYPDHACVEMMGQKRLFIKTDDRGETHRVLCELASGQKVVRPERGWLAIEWKMKEGLPAFVA